MITILGPSDPPPQPEAPVRVSVIIPTFRRRQLVEIALHALAEQSMSPADYEVNVIVDGSTDGTAELLAAAAPAYRLRGVLQPNRGAAAARNAGIRMAAGELLVFLDDDMEPAPRLLESHLAAHAGQPRLAVLGAAPIWLDAQSSPLVNYVAAKFNEHLARLATTDLPLGIRDFYGGNFSVRRALLDEVGRFDEAFRAYGNEDLDMAVRLKRAGVTLAYSADAMARQRYPKDLPALAQDALSKGRTAVFLAGKHPEFVAQSKLATWRAATPARRTFLESLIRLSQVWQRTPDAVVGLLGRLERRHPARLPLYYSLVTDYLFWLGVRNALADNRRAGHGLTALAGDRQP